MSINIYCCWTCQKRLSDDLPFEFYFWCNKTCYEKDDLYHGRKKMLSELAETEEKKPSAVIEEVHVDTKSNRRKKTPVKRKAQIRKNNGKSTK